jgi:hypothetical protein
MVAIIQFTVFSLIVPYHKCKDLNINIILSAFLYGCEAWVSLPTKEHRLNGFEIKVLRRISYIRGSKWYQDRENWALHNEELHSVLWVCSVMKSKGITWSKMYNWLEKSEMHSGLGSENLKWRDNSGDPSVEGRIILKWLINYMVWTNGVDSSSSG